MKHVNTDGHGVDRERVELLKGQRIYEALKKMRLPGDKLSWADAVDEAAAFEGVSPIKACSGDRHKTAIKAKHRAWLTLRTLQSGGYSYPEIARAFETDHGSVMNGVRKAEMREAAVLGHSCGRAA